MSSNLADLRQRPSVPTVSASPIKSRRRVNSRPISIYPPEQLVILSGRLRPILLDLLSFTGLLFLSFCPIKGSKSTFKRGFIAGRLKTQSREPPSIPVPGLSFPTYRLFAPCTTLPSCSYTKPPDRPPDHP